jgi:FkbM family methyltransferase
MIDYSNPFLFFLRTFGQRLGLLRPLQHLARRLQTREYESAFRSELIKYIRPGQIIWDIGANEGFYVDLLLKLVGPNGTIVAFEPSPESYEILTQKFSGYPNVHLKNVALADQNGVASFFQSPTSVTNSLAYNKNATSQIRVMVERGDTYVTNYSPDVMKIDVEGYEYEVLKGMQKILSSPKLKCIFLEVHFSIMRERGFRGGPKSIVHMLTQAGLAVRWTDPSHLVASRA